MRPAGFRANGTPDFTDPAWRDEPLGFFRGLLIALPLSLLIWVALWFAWSRATAPDIACGEYGPAERSACHGEGKQ